VENRFLVEELSPAKSFFFDKNLMIKVGKVVFILEVRIGIGMDEH
jgi:hypothetical protein